MFGFQKGKRSKRCVQSHASFLITHNQRLSAMKREKEGERECKRKRRRLSNTDDMFHFCALMTSANKTLRSLPKDGVIAQLCKYLVTQVLNARRSASHTSAQPPKVIQGERSSSCSREALPSPQQAPRTGLAGAPRGALNPLKDQQGPAQRDLVSGPRGSSDGKFRIV